MEIRPGEPYALGARWDGAGTNFAVFSGVAEGVQLCLWEDGRELRLPLAHVGARVWCGYVPGVAPGRAYGFRVLGPYRPARGFWTNPLKLMLDPYARAVEGGLDWDGPVFACAPHHENQPDLRDSAASVPRAVVVDPSFPWEGDRPPRTPWGDTVIYETHVKGFTARHPDVPEALRGTYAGLASPPALDHLTRLGVTAVELLPVHHFLSEQALVRAGLVNYWGYNPVGWFAPHAAYSSCGSAGRQVREFKAMVRTLHAAGIEVILDVVYNHTAEGGRGGPSLSLRGLDNPSYYRLDQADPCRYVDYTGCGNTVDLNHLAALRLVMDSLRYWVEEMHVDGFRFDLAPALERGRAGFDDPSPFLAAVHQDPVLSRVKLIAEPWDLGHGGYRLGRYPPGWAEWNGRYRDWVRDMWRGQRPAGGDTARRLTGSGDLFPPASRRLASVNFVTVHDGFTLRDLVSYEQKHNWANGEHNRDGTDDNRSWNCGVEGETGDECVLALRRRQQRNFLLTLLVSGGVPMLLGGDEAGRTQRGNNNAYCQDNELSWQPWDLDDEARDLAEFTRRAIRLRREHPAFALPERRWVAPDGRVLGEEELADADLTALGMLLDGDHLAGPFLVLLNPGPAPVRFRLPEPDRSRGWEVVLDTAEVACGYEKGRAAGPGEEVEIQAWSSRVLRGTG